MGGLPTHLSISSNNQLILLQIKPQEKTGEARLINATTNTIFDLSAGKNNVIDIALSNSASKIAMITHDENGLLINIDDLTNKKVTTFQLDSYSAVVRPPVLSKAISVCKWSSLKWSPDDSSLLIFLCYSEKSVLISISANTETQNAIYPLTTASENSPRSAQWLSDTQIVYTTKTESEESLSKLDLQNQTTIEILYSIKSNKR